MSAVTDKQDAIVHKSVKLGAGEPVNTHPVDGEGLVANHRPQPPGDIFLTLFFRLVGIRLELEIDPVDIVRLFVQQRRITVVKIRFEPEPSLGSFGSVQSW